MAQGFPVNPRLIIEDDGTCAVITVRPERFVASEVIVCLIILLLIATCCGLAYHFLGSTFLAKYFVWVWGGLVIVTSWVMTGRFLRTTRIVAQPGRISVRRSVRNIGREKVLAVADLEMPELMPPFKRPLAKNDSGFFIYVRVNGKSTFLIANAGLNLLDAKRIVILLQQRA